MNSNVSQYGVILVTVASPEEAEEIARVLLTEKLAACVNIFPVNSIYIWQKKINRDREWQLTIKTNLAIFDKIQAKIKTLHKNEVPEIIAIPIVAGSPQYLNWIEDSLK
ncbi:divalent-cation tolerance protein CutA [Myxosarcina sp. GI1]|uniref:divalent-cation tolerance protein CutA n=1 Tax=Myxosarcina sp. GI1 TaxID=1541065 RepID=UPI000560C506|nr:divalent-cation tolerance protein CutA [Myxosarcina sp. GI1]